jgi:hypothetical protein
MELPRIGCLPVLGAAVVCFAALVLLSVVLGPWSSWLIVFGTSVWVGVDASNLGVRRGLVKGMGDMTVTEWVVGCLLFWIVFFPEYIVARPVLQEMIPKNPPIVPAKGMSTLTKVMLGILAVFVIFIGIVIASG